MSEDYEEEEDKELIHYSGNYGGISQDSKFWDDYEDMGEEELLKHKIIKIRIYLGTIKKKQVIFGINYTFQNLFTGEILVTKDHRGSEDFIDIREFNIRNDEYLNEFHIRFPYGAEYISQLGFVTNKKRMILVGTEDGEYKNILSNGEDNVILGTCGCFDKKLDAIGCLYISKKEYLKRILFSFFMLRHLVKKDTNFKKEWDKKYKSLPQDYQYLWKTVNISDDKLFSQIIKFCYL